MGVRMNVLLRQPRTQAQFFAWHGHQEGRYEFDGLQPVAMTGGTANHSIITLNVLSALRSRLLRSRLGGSGCRALGPDAGLATVGETVRYPDALVTCSKFEGTALTIPGVVIVVEVVSPGSEHMDRIVKAREYAAVPTLRRYLMVESTGIGVTVFAHADAGQTWNAEPLTGGDTVQMPEINVQIPVAEFYADVDFGSGHDGAALLP